MAPPEEAQGTPRRVFVQDRKLASPEGRPRAPSPWHFGATLRARAGVLVPPAARSNVPPAQLIRAQPFREVSAVNSLGLWKMSRFCLHRGRVSWHGSLGSPTFALRAFGAVTRGFCCRCGDGRDGASGHPLAGSLSSLLGAFRKAPSFLALHDTTTQGPGCNYCYSRRQDSGTPGIPASSSGGGSGNFAAIILPLCPPPRGALW